MSNISREKIAKLSLPKEDLSAEEAKPKKFKKLFLVLVVASVSIVLYQNRANLRGYESSESHERLELVSEYGGRSQHSIEIKPQVPVNVSDVNTDRKQAETVSTSPKKVLDASGHVVARRIATISSRVTSKVEELLIEEGQYVSKDSVLAELDKRQAQYAYESSKAALNGIKTKHRELESELKLVIVREKRTRSLYQQNLISKEKFEDATLLLEQMTSKLESSFALIEQAEQEVKINKYYLEQHSIKAPFSGVVIQKNAQVGELISAGNSGGGTIRTGVATIVDMESLEIEVDVTEKYINRVAPGQKVIAYLDAYPTSRIDSEVLTIIPTANRQKATIKVRIKFLELNKRILPDMGVKVSFLDIDNAIANE